MSSQLSKISEQLSNINESIAKKRFKKAGLKVKKLDKDKTSRCPDFLIEYKNEPKFICEVKTIISADYHKELGHISIHNPKLNQKGFWYDSFQKIEEVLKKAVVQYKEFIKSKQEFRGLPFLIAIFPDPFVIDFSIIPKDIFGIKEISALLKIEEDLERKRELDRITQGMSSNEFRDFILDFIEGRRCLSLPSHSKKWLVLRNAECFNMFK